ncbi:MAG: PilZ domain-containing protein [Desulfoarculaceae bacterium]|nr:PilZ domain-containing protein [Desulfoarculaceae bacterium]
MKSRRKYPRNTTQQDVDLYLYDTSNNCQLTGRVSASISDLSSQGAGLKFSQALINGQHLCYAALESDTIFVTIVFQPTDDDSKNMTILLARPVWFDRDMEDSTMPFRMGVQFVDQNPPAALSVFI